MLLEQRVELGGIDDALVGHAVGDQHDAAGAVGVEALGRELEAVVDVGAAAGLEGFDEFGRGADVFGSGGRPAEDFAGAGLKRDQAKAVGGAHLAEGLADAVGKRGDLALHGAGHVEHVGIVGVGDWLQIDAGRDDHHERAGFRFVGAVGDHLDPARQVVGEAIVEHKVAVEFRAGAVERKRVVAGIEFPRDGGTLETGHAHVVNRPGGFERHVDREHAFDGRMRGLPEALGDLVRAALLERIHVSTDTGVDLQRLIIHEAQLRLGLCAHRRDLELVVLETVFGGETGVVALGLFLFVDGFGLFFRQDFAMERFLARGDRDLREAGALRNGKRVNRFEVGCVGIEKSLEDLGLGEAVVDGDVHLMGTDLERRMRRSDGSQRAAGEDRCDAGSEGEQTGEKQGCSFHNNDLLC